MVGYVLFFLGIGEIIIYTGMRGSGKTLSCVIDIIKFYKKGYTIYSNHSLFGIPYILLNHPTEILDLPEKEKKVVSIDEGYQWCSCYEKDLNISQFNLNLFAATRKKNMNVFITSQKLHQMSFKTRELVDYLVKPIYMKKFHILKKHYFRFDEQFNFMTIPIYVETRIIKNPERYFKYFDTYELLDGFKNDVWKNIKNKKKNNGKKLNLMRLEEF